MKTLFSLLPLIVCSLFLSAMTAQAVMPVNPLDSKAASTTAETFLADYLNYLKSENNKTDAVAKSKLVTPEFKKTFKKAMADKELDSDPVIFAQDVPITPFKAESSKVKGDTATVVVMAKYNAKEKSRLTVTLVAKDNHWLISKIEKTK